MIAFKVSNFCLPECERQLRKLFNEYLSSLPKHIAPNIYGQSGRFVWIPDGLTPKYSKNEILNDIKNKGDLYRDILQTLLEEAENA